MDLELQPVTKTKVSRTTSSRSEKRWIKVFNSLAGIQGWIFLCDLNDSFDPEPWVKQAVTMIIMAVWVVEFSNGWYKIWKILPKKQHTKRKPLHFEFWINGKLSKSAKILLSKSIFYVKNHRNLSDFFFSLKNIN